MTIVPLSLYLKGSWIKLTIGVGKGKKMHDKRQDEKQKVSKRNQLCTKKIEYYSDLMKIINLNLLNLEEGKDLDLQLTYAVKQFQVFHYLANEFCTQAF